MITESKKNQVDHLISKLETHPHFVLITFTNTSHRDLEEIRTGIKSADSALKVIKNSLFEKAVRRLSQKTKYLGNVQDTVFPIKDHTLLLTLGDDYALGLSTFYKLIAKKDSLTFKFGVLDGKLYQDSELLKIAKLPSRLELLARVIGSIKSPSSRLVHSMKFGISKLTLVLIERSKQN